jgi:hypothetical protein
VSRSAAAHETGLLVRQLEWSCWALGGRREIFLARTMAAESCWALGGRREIFFVGAMAAEAAGEKIFYGP